MESANNDTHASEQTPLMIAQASSVASSDRSNVAPLGGEEPAVAAVDGESSIASSDEELEKEWPATFERGISLLAGPKLDVSMVDKITKSPKIVAPAYNQFRKKNIKNLKRGYNTPDPEKGFHGGVQYSDHFKKGITSVKSLDFPHRPAQGSDAQFDKKMEHDRRQIEAKAYRQKLLSKKGAQPTKGSAPKDEVEDATYSPGYHREKRSEAHSHEMAAMGGDDKATFMQCVFNLANILMGVGMLGLPFVYKSAGWIGGTGVLLIFGVITWRTTILLGRELNGDPRPGHYFDDSPYKSPLQPGSSAGARMRRPITSFPEIARDAFGENGCICLSSILYFELFSCLCIFLVTLGNHLYVLFPSISETKHMIMIACVLVIPTAVLRTPRLLSYLSAVGTIATIAVVLSVALTSVLEGDISEEVAISKGKVNDLGSYHDLWIASGLPLALGLVAYTFSGHAIVPSIYSSMKRPQDFERMATVTFVIVLACCLLTAVAGYYMFGNVVDDQVTISLEASAGPKAELAMKMLTWLMVLTAFSKFTLTMYPLSLGMEEIVAPYLPSDTAMDITSSLVKIILIILSLLVAIYAPSFSFLCSLVGLICTVIVSVVFPAAAHLKLFGSKLSIFEKLGDWLMVIVGLVVAVIGTIATVKNDVGA
uniref:Amino acid transporter transmembrane domain-containing protein n=2 Tax=Ditylum brightwellii TaxID=49249 RepID=A0A6U3SKZ3_9STRA|mmetsp:Transcript_32053/g.47819  ORF Transcript_32053/g.47819 Transcript_32053/m.47819 type:complete len:652 (+) Transcript_32053:97-2052(+)